MNSKSLKVVLISLALGLSFQVSAEKMPESPKQKEARIETALNMMFQESIKAGMAELDKDQTVSPYAFVLRSDGKVGYFSATDDSNTNMTVMEQSQRIRRMLNDMAQTKQIDASVQTMFASVKQGDIASQGLVFEIEHRDGVSMSRFLPMEKVKDKDGKETDKWLLNTSKLSSSIKEKAVFTAPLK